MLAHRRNDEARVETDRRRLLGKDGLTIGILVTVALVAAILYFSISTYMGRDTNGAPLLRANGTITGVAPGAGSRNVEGRSDVITVRWGKETKLFNTIQHWQVGKGIEVRYRVGKSGRIYVDDIVPLPAARQGAADRH